MKKYEYEVVNLADKENKQVYCTGPQEFVDYFNSAEVVFTDSFHGCVFSILMRKPFLAFKRIGSCDMYSRIETLLEMFDLKDRQACSVKNAEDVFAADFTHVSSLLQHERVKAFAYLEKALVKL